MSSLASCPVTSLLSFSCAHTTVRALVCTRTSTVHLGFRAAQVLIMRFGSLFVCVHLVPSSSQPLTLLPCLVLFSCLHLFVLGCAHLRTHVLTLVFASPRVCVCVTLEITELLLKRTACFLLRLTAGGKGISSCGLSQRSSTHWMIRKTYLLGAPGRIVRRSWWPPFFLFFCKVLVHLQM